MFSYNQLESTFILEKNTISSESQKANEWREKKK